MVDKAERAKIVLLAKLEKYHPDCQVVDYKVPLAQNARKEKLKSDILSRLPDLPDDQKPTVTDITKEYNESIEKLAGPFGDAEIISAPRGAFREKRKNRKEL